MCMMIKDKYIDPFTDFGFKRIFGSEENKHLLISFLNDLLDIDDNIVNLEYRNLEKMGLNILDRKAIFDVYCTDTKGNSFIVELQRSKQKYFKDRSVYYTTFPIQEQSNKGDWDYSLKKIFFVGILDFCIDDKEYLTTVQLKDDAGEVFYDKLKYYYIQMPNFKKQEKELSNHLEYWLYYLKHLADSQEIPKVLAHDELITEAFGVAEFLALSKDQQFAYQLDLKHRLDYKNVMDYAKEEAEKKGEKMGVIKIAKSLFDVLDIETIALKTGLSVEELNQLKDS
ncbi:MAG: PD-(D/E)XK nuclease family transposase [Thiotrichaceae bacterium]|nr:PD-(D/E)XK nuclease family transposase [Thiotrichaceae bacterium]